jgi:hypothetical protein
MNTKTTRRPRLGLVAGVLAVAIATSSGAYAAGAMITSSNQLKNGVVNTGDIKNGTVRVKDLNQKTVNALNPAPVQIEDWHVVGTAGQPGYEGSWGNFPSYAAPGFRIDEETKVVHLRGAATFGSDNAGTSTVFVLPTGYRPVSPLLMPVATTDGLGGESASGTVIVQPDGSVRVLPDGDDRFVSFEGLSFSLG